MNVRLPNKDALMRGMHQRFTADAKDAPLDPPRPYTPAPKPAPTESPGDTDHLRRPRRLPSGSPIPVCFMRGFGTSNSDCQGCHAFTECGTELGEYQAMFGPLITLSELSQAVCPKAWEPDVVEPHELTIQKVREIYNRLQGEILTPRTQMLLDLCIPSHRDHLHRIRKHVIDSDLPLEPFLYAQMATLRGMCTEKHLYFRPNMCYGANATERYRQALMRTEKSRVHITEDSLRSALPCGVDTDYKNLVLAEEVLGAEYLPRAICEPECTLRDYLADANADLLPEIWWVVHAEYHDLLTDWRRRVVRMAGREKLKTDLLVEKYNDLARRARCEAACLVVGYYGPYAARRINVLPTDIDSLWEVLATPCRVLGVEFRKTHAPRNPVDSRIESLIDNLGTRVGPDDLFTEAMLITAAKSTDDGSDQDDYALERD